MDPSFVQNVSRQTVEPYGFEHRTFTNMSSQQMNPGELPSYFDASETIGYMPFPHRPTSQCRTRLSNPS